MTSPNTIIADLQAENETLRTRLAELEKQEPVHWRAVLSQQHWNLAPNIAGFTTLRAAEQFCAEKKDFGGWNYELEPLFTAPAVSPDVEKMKDEISELKSHNKLIMDMYVQYSDENQSLKTELVNWKSRCEHRVADIQLQAKRVVDLEATMRSLKTEFESVRKDAEWQPIETAPKDGSVIVLGARNGVWLGKYKPVYQSGFRPENPWRSMMLNHDHMAKRHTRPTHWKPLPEPPAIEQASSCNELHEKGGV